MKTTLSGAEYLAQMHAKDAEIMSKITQAQREQIRKDWNKQPEPCDWDDYLEMRANQIAELKKKDHFEIRMPDEPDYVTKIEGKPVIIEAFDDYDFFYRKTKLGYYKIYEKRSGMPVALESKTLKGAKEEAVDRIIRNRGRDVMEKRIKEFEAMEKIYFDNSELWD